MKIVLALALSLSFTAFAVTSGFKSPKRKIAMAEENECTFGGKAAEHWFHKLPKITDDCHYMESQNDIAVCGAKDMASVICKKIGRRYKCGAYTLVPDSGAVACQDSSFPSMY